MAPEQAWAITSITAPTSTRTGVILYEMVAGRRPFIATSGGEVMVQHLTTRRAGRACSTRRGIPPRSSRTYLAAGEGRIARKTSGRSSGRRHSAKARPPGAGSTGALRDGGNHSSSPAAPIALLATTAWIRSGSLFASTPSIAAARARLRARITGEHDAPKVQRPIDGARTPFQPSSARGIGQSPGCRRRRPRPCPSPWRPWWRARPPPCRRRRWRRPAASRRRRRRRNLLPSTGSRFLGRANAIHLPLHHCPPASRVCEHLCTDLHTKNLDMPSTENETSRCRIVADKSPGQVENPY